MSNDLFNNDEALEELWDSFYEDSMRASLLKLGFWDPVEREEE